MASQNKVFRKKINQFPEQKKIPKDIWMIRSHFKKRYEERFENRFNKTNRKEIEALIQSKKRILIEQQTSVKFVYNVNYHNKDLYVVWDSKLKELVTVLTEDMINERRVINV